MNRRETDSLPDFLSRVNACMVFDHSGRGGNGFFMTIFDRHPEVLGCHWSQYLYSYLVTEFGDADRLDPAQALAFVLEKSTFRLVLSEPTAQGRAMLTKLGANPDLPLDRAAGRRVLEDFLRNRPAVPRRELVLACHYALAVALGRDTAPVRYILTADALSLRSEHFTTGFSGRVAEALLHDFPQARCVTLVRDPRAVFASNRHQFVNANGNMYGVTPGTFLRRMANIATMRQQFEDCAYLFWLPYCAAAWAVARRVRQRHPEHFRLVKNEDLNTRFEATLRPLCGWLGVSFWEPWTAPDYAPTSLGGPWRGAGAYNSRYQTNTSGPLENDPQDIADRTTGPNEYVTKRWMSRLAPHEARLVELLNEDEMRSCGYEALRPPLAHASLGRVAACLLRPLRGEFPGPRWLADGFGLGARELSRRLFYLGVAPLLALAGRLALLRLVRQGFFQQPPVQDPTPGEGR
ncbi:MAG: sulfotransferase [Desulfovibrio sp.]